MAYIAPPGIGNPAVTREAAAAMRRRAAVLEDMLNQMQAAHDGTQFEGPGGDRFRRTMMASIHALHAQADACRRVAGRLDHSADGAARMLDRQRREQQAEAQQRARQRSTGDGGGW